MVHLWLSMATILLVQYGCAGMCRVYEVGEIVGVQCEIGIMTSIRFSAKICIERGIGGVQCADTKRY